MVKQTCFIRSLITYYMTKCSLEQMQYILMWKSWVNTTLNIDFVDVPDLRGITPMASHDLKQLKRFLLHMKMGNIFYFIQCRLFCNAKQIWLINGKTFKQILSKKKSFVAYYITLLKGYRENNLLYLTKTGYSTVKPGIANTCP